MNSEKLSPQEIFWSQKIGQAYMEHNKFEPIERKKHRSEFYQLFENYDKNSKILEVGCNLGTNIKILENMNFNNLYGIDIFEGAINTAKTNVPNANFKVGTALNLPYKDNEFDIVFTSGVLIHQDPDTILPKVLSEIYRVSNKTIIGLEDYRVMFKSRMYRGEEKRYWSGPYHKAFQHYHKDLKPITKSQVEHHGLPRIQYVFEK